MIDSTEIDASHPIWPELRNGFLWHRTSPKEYRQISTDGFIKPNTGQVNRWGGPYACQQLGGVSLFDFTSQPENKVLAEAHKWQQFIGDARPATVLLGLDRTKLPGRLTPYPENKAGTTGNVIPWVEVCHCGQIPVSAIVSHLVICAADYSRFKKTTTLNEPFLTEIEMEFGRIVQQQAAARAKLIEQFNNSLQLQKTKIRAKEVRGQQ